MVYLLTFAIPTGIRYFKSGGTHAFWALPRVPYVFSNSQHTSAAAEAKVAETFVSDSLFYPRLPPFVVRPTGGRGESVLFFAGAGGYGDQVMAWPVAKFLHDLGYVVHVLCDPGNDHLWSWFPWIASTRVLPQPLAEFDNFEHLAIYPYVTNVDEHAGQPHPTDHLLRLIGVDPATVPAAAKRVKPLLTMGQMSIVASMPENLGVFQLSGSNIVRRPSAERLRKALRAVLTVAPGNWVGLHDQEDDNFKAAQELQTEFPNFRVMRDLTFDELVGITVAAKLTVGPDSFITHLRGALGLPGVAVFGTHDPLLRTRYYPEIRSLWERQVCPSSPCMAYRRVFPRYLCPPSNAPRVECEVLGAGYEKLAESVKMLWSS